MLAPAMRRLFTVEDYERMAESGILTEDDHVELIEGEIINMSAMGALHADRVSTIADLLGAAARDHARIRTQCPVRLSKRTEPEPDVAVVARRSYRRAHPGPADVLLLVEVADTSLDHDRSTKIPLYAKEGIREVWLVDLIEEAIERYSEPTADGYRAVLRVERGGSIASLTLPAVNLRVDDVLG